MGLQRPAAGDSIQAGGLTLSFYPCDGGPPACTNNNGNMWREKITSPGISGTVTQEYRYDGLNRLAVAAENPSGSVSPTSACSALGGSWCQQFGYDAYGNRWVGGATGISAAANTPQSSSSFDGSNHVTANGAVPDTRGNLQQIGAVTYSYDAENRLKSAVSGSSTIVSYAYDGEGRRVQKTAGSTTTTYVYDAQGGLAAEYGGSAPACTTCYLTVDHLGSTRMMTDAHANVVALHDFQPFGEEVPGGIGGRNAASYGLTDDPKQKFTGKERDSETANSADPNGLDFFGARYFSSAQGRWTSPDWSATPQPIPYADLKDPQSINLYSYVRNNPLAKADADGHCFWDLCIGEGAAVYAVGAAVVTTAAYLMTPQGQDSARAAIVGSGLLINKAADALGSLIFSTSRPGTLGKPDHQQTVEDEAKRVNGDTEVPIPTPGGAKQGRRADAVGTNPDTGAPEIVQVYRPTPAGNIPKREKQAAADIQGATGVEPTMVPVRPLPPPKPPCTPTDGGGCK